MFYPCTLMIGSIKDHCVTLDYLHISQDYLVYLMALVGKIVSLQLDKCKKVLLVKYLS